MNIVVISQHYYPDNFRINEIVEVLVKNKHQVTVITGLPDYSTSKIPTEYRFFRKRKEILNGAKIIRVPTIARRSGVTFRVFNYASFVISALTYASFCKVKDIDAVLVYQTSPVFQAIPAKMIKKRAKCKMSLYCCDLWPESLKAWHVSENNIVFKIVKKISKKLYQSCDKIAVTSTPFIDYLHDTCEVDLDKIFYLPQHCDDDYETIVGQYIDNDCIDFMFAGNIGSVQNVDCIIKSISNINCEKPFKVHIVGDGSELENLKTLVAERNVNDKVVFHGRCSGQKLMDLYHMADCLLLTLRGDDLIGSTLPAKCQTYLSLGKPIAAAINGAGYDLINTVECGQATTAGDEVGLAKIMSNVINNFDEFKLKGAKGRQHYLENFTISIFMDGFYKIINNDVN